MSGRRRARADEVLQRLLLTLPLGARDEGVPIDVLAEELGVEPARILRDLEEVKTRSYYLRAGMGDQIRLAVTHELLQVETTGEFDRPVRLTAREALALELALRVTARRDGDGGPSRASTSADPSFRQLRERVVRRLRSPESDDEAGLRVSLGGAEADGDPVRETVRRALRHERELRIRYRAPGRPAQARRVGPILMAHAQGRWYLVGRDLDRKGLRAFRLDRMVEVREGRDGYTPSVDDRARAESFLEDGRVHDGGGADAPEAFHAVVEYSSRIARWVREHRWEDTEELESGALRVRHRVLDPEWLLRHVLQYGAEAELREPEWLRERLRETVAALRDRTGGAEATDTGSEGERTGEARRPPSVRPEESQETG